MLQETPFDSPRAAQFHLDMIAYLRQADGQTAIQNAIRYEVANIGQFAFETATNDHPAWWWGGGPDLEVVYIDGAVNWQLALQYVTGAGVLVNDEAFQGVNVFLRNIQQAIAVFRRPLGRPRPRSLIIAGYSLGGAAAMALARWLTANRYTADIFIVTFGSPKPGNRDFVNSVGDRNIVRWMLSEDPIPLIPPAPNQVLASGLRIGPLGIQSWSRNVQAAGGISISLSSRLDSAVLPAIAQLTPMSSLETWFLAREQEQDGIHSIARYKQRLMNAFQSSSGGGEDVDPYPRPEQRAPVTLAAANRVERSLAVNVIAAERRQNNVPVVIPDPWLAYARRIGGVWTVIFDSVPVMTTPSKRAARRFARQLNAWLRSAQSSAVVDTTALNNAFANYLAAAVNPAANFQPVMNNDPTDVSS